MSDINAVTLWDAIAMAPGTTGVDVNGPYCALQATGSAGTAQVLTGTGRTTTIYLPLGQVVYLMHQGVFSGGGTTATNIVGFKAPPNASPKMTG